MLIIIRNDEEISKKTEFILQFLRNKFCVNSIILFRKPQQKFFEKWSSNEIQLPFSIRSLMVYYLLAMLKSPKDLRDGLMVRFSFMRRRKIVLTEKGFLSILSRVLYLFFGSSARTNNFLPKLKYHNHSMIFLIDEFLSLKCIDLGRLSEIGSIVYVSQDTAYNRFGFGDNLVTRKLMFRLEQDAFSKVDLVVACSEMEKLKYLEMGAKKATFYPNVYPTRSFEPSEKDHTPSIALVLREHWGRNAKDSLKKILYALNCIGRRIRVYIIGLEPTENYCNIEIVHFGFLESKSEYLKILSKSWIGINIGIHLAGTNERKFDYAEAGMVVLSDQLGSRGDLIPHEYTYVDAYDLASKLKELIGFGEERLTRMGRINRDHILSVAEKEQSNVEDNFEKLLS